MRTGAIFFVGISALVLTTIGVSTWINGIIDQHTQRLAVLEQLSAQLDRPTADREVFQQNLALLQHGTSPGQTSGATQLTPVTDEVLIAAFRRIDAAWSAARNGRSESLLELRAALDQATDLIRLQRADNLGMARGLFAALFLSTICFLLIGLWFTEELVAKPFEELIQVTSRITAGDLDTPIAFSESDAFEEVASSFEAMRLELRESRERLSRWASDLEKRVTQRTQQIAALSQVVTAASHSQELEQVLRTALEQALQVMDAPTGGLWLVDEASSHLQLAVSHGMSAVMRQQVQALGYGEGATGRAAETGETIVLEDITQGSTIVKTVAIKEGIRSLVAVPIKVRERVVAVLDVMMHQQRAYTPEEIALLTSIGQQIGIGVENARLIREIRQQTERVAALQEREWISAELHDGLLQNLGYLHLQADQLEAQALSNDLADMAGQLAHQRAVLEQTSREIRSFITDLREAPPPPVSLQGALEKMVAEFTRDTPIPITIDLPATALWLKADHVAHLVRIAREALLNATRHGHARSALLTCTVRGGQGELSVRDDGAGFDPKQLPDDGRGHFGLRIMPARAARLGGKLTIDSVPGHGTRVSITWPLEMAS
ncbi:MAG: GAF domain-containing protein [Chloroflexi bacterium]|nr:GAF domain-containing protein [Chloroflexota bacterium]